MFAFSVVTVKDEHTKPTIGSKESVGVKFKEGYAPNCVWSSGLKATGIFVILLSQDGFESDCPERKY